MPLTIKDPEIVRLSEYLARRRGISKTGVIRHPAALNMGGDFAKTDSAAA